MLLAQTVGNLDDAQTHFEGSLELRRKSGYRPELAWSLCDYADVLLERDDKGDKAQAMSLLDEFPVSIKNIICIYNQSSIFPP